MERDREEYKRARARESVEVRESSKRGMSNEGECGRREDSQSQRDRVGEKDRVSEREAHTEPF